MHKQNIVHRDIKCLNIFMTEFNEIKLGDMGISEFLELGTTLHGKRVGTPLYLSPELVKNYQYSHKVDIWGVGCAIYHLACLENPFQGENLIALSNQIRFTKPKPLPPVYSNRFSQFVENLLMKTI